MSEKWFKDGITDSSVSKKDFYYELLSTVWGILSPDEGNDESMVGLWTGFCVNPQALILTCHNVVETGDSIYCVNMGSNEGYVSAKVVRSLPSWNMTLLKLDEVENKKFDYVKMADELDRVFCGQDVYDIGNPDELNGSFMIGKVVYACDEYNLNDLIVDFSGGTSNYNNRASVYDPMRLHGTISNIASGGGGVFATLNPNVPVFQIGRFCADQGASGSPVFNERGCVVGMYFMGDSGQSSAIHFYALNHFIDRVRCDLDDEAKRSETIKKIDQSKDRGGSNQSRANQ